MCGAFLTWKDLPAVADMSIDTQLKSCQLLPAYIHAYSNATVRVRGNVSYRSVRPSLEVSPKQAPINPRRARQTNRCLFKGPEIEAACVT